MQQTPILDVRNLHVSVDDTEILKGVNLTINPGEIHAIMGPNGSGKSTLANALAGHPRYTITSGEILFKGEKLLEMPPEDRARKGLFLSFQHPIEVPGVRLDQFIRAGLNSIRKNAGIEELDPLKFDRILKEKARIVDIDPTIAKRITNEGFSGGERKRSEILQMAVLNPQLSVLDEPDSGLDVDALYSIAKGINQMLTSETSLIIVTHYQRILNYVIPDMVHVLISGQLVKSGNKDLALEVEANGYEQYEAAISESPTAGS